MDNDTSEGFNALLKRLRKARGVTHRAIAEAVGLKPQSYANVEAKPHKAMARDKVERLAAFYGLGAEDRAALLAAWDALPASEYSTRQQKGWTERRARRAKSQHHDAMQVALVEILSLYLGTFDDFGQVGDPAAAACTCAPADPFGGDAERVCEVCTALRVLGYPSRFNGLDPVLAFLATQQESLTPAEAACR